MGRGIAEEALVLLRKRLSDLNFIFSLLSYCPDSNYSYALPSGKAKAVARDTLVIWCSLASRLGHWALKAELEDLCFAVLQPQIFQQMRSDLASLWTPSSSSSKVGNLRSLSAKSSSNPEYEASTEDVVVSMKDLLQAVIPFDLLLDRRKRIKYIQDPGSCSEVQKKPKVVRDVGIALASLVVCEEELECELFISTSYVPGMEVTLSSRLKSLYSIYSKMNRKDVSIDKVYDARALRVIVGDKSGTLHGQTVECCYSLLNIIHKLWTPIDGECDDYIVNPKSGRYQSMHEYVEHGVAAHWLYKEVGNKLSTKSNVIGSEITSSSYLSNDMEDKSPVEDDMFHKYRSQKPRDLVLRVEGSHLFAAVIVRDLLVVASFVLAASEAVADRRSSSQRKRWEAYARLYKKVDINVSPDVVVRVLQRGGGENEFRCKRLPRCGGCICSCHPSHKVMIVVVAVPEGLPLVVTLTLAYSLRKMMSDKALALTKILARQLVRLRQQIANLQSSRAQMRGITTHTHALVAHSFVAVGMKGATKAMATMNKPYTTLFGGT
ncbi:unnamed protein product [Lactuca saligna]|uniref:RelA/SpoT domain-containing protein n=1 Tax=Lactuca saligna TaxID=75948 RepID=A0AA36EEY4_LACSI|nr:unnamed protein product [Lactuca saligna]